MSCYLMTGLEVIVYVAQASSSHCILLIDNLMFRRHRVGSLTLYMHWLVKVCVFLYMVALERNRAFWVYRCERIDCLPVRCVLCVHLTLKPEQREWDCVIVLLVKCMKSQSVLGCSLCKWREWKGLIAWDLPVSSVNSCRRKVAGGSPHGLVCLLVFSFSCWSAHLHPSGAFVL